MDKLVIHTGGMKANTYVADAEGRSLNDRVRGVWLRTDAAGETEVVVRIGPDYRLVAG